MRIALTGGAAGIGAALVQKLYDAGHELVVFDVNKPSGPVGQWVCHRAQDWQRKFYV